MRVVVGRDGSSPRIPEVAEPFVAEFLPLRDLAAFAVAVGNLRARDALHPVIERTLLRANHELLTEEEDVGVPLFNDYYYDDNNFWVDYDYFPRLSVRRASPLLEARAYLLGGGLQEELHLPDAPEALMGIFAHGEAFGSYWYVEFESSMLLSLPDMRASHRGARTLVVVTNAYDNGSEDNMTSFCSTRFTVIDDRYFSKLCRMRV